MTACLTTGRASLTSPFAMKMISTANGAVNTDPNCQEQRQVELKYQALVIGPCVH